METTSDRGRDDMDPEAQLTMLEDIQDSIEAEAWMPTTPVWDAPLLATAIAGLTLVNDGPAGWAIAGAVVGAFAAALCLVGQHRRRRASPRRIAKPLRPLAFYLFILTVTFSIIAMWGLIDLPDRPGPAALTLTAAWLATTIVFALGIATTNRMHDHWAASKR